MIYTYINIQNHAVASISEMFNSKQRMRVGSCGLYLDMSAFKQKECQQMCTWQFHFLHFVSVYSSTIEVMALCA